MAIDIDNPIVIITLITIALLCRAYISYAENNSNRNKGKQRLTKKISPKMLKLMIIALYFKKYVPEIYNNLPDFFTKDEKKNLSNYMKMDDLESLVRDIFNNKSSKCIDDTKSSNGYIDTPKNISFNSDNTQLMNSFVQHFETTQFNKQKSVTRETVDVDKMYDMLTVDAISLEFGSGLISMATSKAEWQLLSKLGDLRKTLIDELGFIMPNVSIANNDALGEFEYLIKARGNIIETGEVYPERLMVIAEQWHAKGLEYPMDVITSTDTAWQTQVYWLLPQNIPQHVIDNSISFIAPADVIITHLKACVVKHIDDFMCKNDVIKLMDHVKKQDSTLVNDLLSIISTSDLRKIFVNLIREEVSIKDIAFVFEKLCDYARFSKNPDILSERLRTAFSRQICLRHANEHSILYVVNLSDKWEKILDDSCEITELGSVFVLNPMQVQELVESIASNLTKAHKQVGEQPVVLCSPRIRLALFNLLEPHIPSVVVVSYSELIHDIRVEAVETVGETEND